MLDRLEAADHSSELFALPGIVDRFFDHSLARTEAIGGQEHPAGVPQAPDCGPTIVRESLARYARKPQLPYAPGAVDRFESNLLQTRSIASYEVHTTGGIGYQKRVGFQEVEREQSRSVELCAVEQATAVASGQNKGAA